jgi:hypothetical protein
MSNFDQVYRYKYYSTKYMHYEIILHGEFDDTNLVS